MFYGREDDLLALDRLWNKPVASLVTCRGRRWRTFRKCAFRLKRC